MVLHLMETTDRVARHAEPRPLFTNIPGREGRLRADLAEFGHGKIRGKPYSTRLLSGRVGLDTPPRVHRERAVEAELLDESRRKGYGDVARSISITGWRQCFRPATGRPRRQPDLTA
jgi:hypothetical protein